jgi:hypothetical protein
MKKFYFKNDTRDFSLVDRTYEEFHGITLAFIALDEERDIVEFLKHVRPLVSRIVMIDGGSRDKTVERAKPLVDLLQVIPFVGHLGNLKNRAIEHVFTDWTLFLDPDERLSDGLVKEIPGMIEQDEFDCYSFPRREFLSSKENLIPYPDYQDRLFRTYCRYIRPIHHELVGYKNKCTIAPDSGREILHIKEFDRHTMRNRGHVAFEIHLKHEMGFPSAQLKDSRELRYPYLNTDWRPSNG